MVAPTKAATVGATRAPTPATFSTAPAAGESAIVPILMYHHLADLPAGSRQLRLAWTVAPKNFDAQMNWLVQRGFQTIAMEQLVGHLKHGQPLPSKPIIISFDDGWEDDYSVAFPVLRKYNFRGTFFIYTNALDREGFLTWTQVQEMSAAGMDVQAHTLSHPHLRALAPEAAMKEIAESKAILEKRLGTPVVALAYPFGEYNNAVIGLVKRAGFECAVTINSGYQQRADELFTLHRIRVSYNDTLQNFASRLPQ
jgi:peptidoglycan/xylan/chitin deacetylase (PgdA/CDA1 family)